MENTIEQEKIRLRREWETGTRCKCCGQIVKLYGHKLGYGMAKVLIDMYRYTNGTDQWLHVIKVLKTINGDYAKLRFWGLVDEKGDDPGAEKKASGYWRLTDLGIRFVEGRTTVPQRAYIYDNKCIKLDGDLITIKNALGTKFDYSELMGDFLQRIAEKQPGTVKQTGLFN